MWIMWYMECLLRNGMNLNSSSFLKCFSWFRCSHPSLRVGKRVMLGWVILSYMKTPFLHMNKYGSRARFQYKFAGMGVHCTMEFFIVIILVFFLCLGLICWFLSRGLQRDTFDYDVAFLWDRFDRQVLDSARSKNKK